jgi:hypothetical protein
MKMSFDFQVEALIERHFEVEGDKTTLLKVKGGSTLQRKYTKGTKRVKSFVRRAVEARFSTAASS